jgi:hypothetical protein
MVKNDLGKQKKVDSMCDIFVFLLLSVKIHKTNKTISTDSIGLLRRSMNKHIEFNIPG